MNTFASMVPSSGSATLAGSRPVGFMASVGRKKGSRPIKVPCGTVWPNGEFGLGYAPRVSEITPSVINLAGGVSLEHMREECEKIADEMEGDSLDLTSLPNSHKPSNRPDSYGRKGLSGYGGKMVRNGAHVLQGDVGKRNLTFLTLTLPPMSPEAARAVAESWAESVRQLLQWLVRQLRGRGLSTAVVSVTELQTQRLAGGDSACLHLHAVFQGRRVGACWAISPKMVRAWWLKRLSSVTGGVVHSMNCCDMKSVLKDAGNYLSKYMSKGSEDIEAYANAVGWVCVPRQWWNMTKAARNEVKRRCLRSTGVMQIVESLVNMHYESEETSAFKFVRAIEVKATEYQSFVVGFWGKFNSASIIELQSLAALLKSA